MLWWELASLQIKAMEQLQELLSSQDASSSNCLDFLLGSAREEPGLDNNWLLGQNTFTQNLVKSSSRTVNNWSLIGLSSILGSCLFRNKRPQFVKVDAGLIQVGVVVKLLLCKTKRHTAFFRQIIHGKES